MRFLPLKKFLPLLPLGLAIIAGILIQVFLPELPLLAIRMDFGTGLIFLGGLTSLTWGAVTITRQAAEQEKQRCIEEARAEQGDVRRRFIRRLDHEVKNPLTAMRAALANLPDATSTEERAQLREEILHQMERLGRLVSDLRKLAELEERPIEELPVNLEELLNEVIETARSNPKRAECQVRLAISNVPWPLPPVNGDPDLLFLAFYNLVDNALKFTLPENPIEIRAFEDGHLLSVEIADSGPGIPPEDQDRVFEELFRGANARGIEGSGLGLALVQRIIQRHGGKITLRSRPGQGTVFTVRLPVQKTPPSPKLSSN